jgi:hypothetical protein
MKIRMADLSFAQNGASWLFVHCSGDRAGASIICTVVARNDTMKSHFNIHGPHTNRKVP